MYGVTFTVQEILKKVKKKEKLFSEDLQKSIS